MHILSTCIVRIKLIVLLLVHSGIILAQVQFQDDFNGDLSGWKLINEQFIKIIDSNDPEHGKVLALQPNGNVLALVNDSEKWGAVSVEVQILFPYLHRLLTKLVFLCLPTYQPRLRILHLIRY